MTERRPTLESLLRSERREVLADLLAALHGARGAAVRREGPVITVDGRRHLVVSPALSQRVRDRLRRTDFDRIDVVVAADGARARRFADRVGARAQSADDLDRLARYGLPRSVATGVFEAHLGRPLDSVAPPETARRPGRVSGAGGSASSVSPLGDGLGRPARGPGSTMAGPTLWTTLAVVVGVVLVASAVGLVPLTLDRASPPAASAGQADQSPSAGTGSDTSPGGRPVDGSSLNATNPPTGEGASGSRVTADGRFLAPGMTDAGVTDANRLAAAHEVVLGNQSYRWELRYTESVDSEVTGHRAETVRVRDPTVYTVNVTRNGTVVGPTFVGSKPTVVGVGTDPRVGSQADEQSGRALPAGQQGLRARRALDALLQTQDSTILRSFLGDRRLYVVEFRDSRFGGFENYTATAHVTPRGFVPYVSASYCLHPIVVDPTNATDGRGDGPVCAELTMRFEDLGTTTVHTTPWYAGARVSMRPPARLG